VLALLIMPYLCFMTVSCSFSMQFLCLQTIWFICVKDAFDTKPRG
jgi:hypothetical protein